MHGPPLTRNEIIELLAGEVLKLACLGVPYHAATEEVARRHRIKQSQVEVLIDKHPVAWNETPLIWQAADAA